MVRYDDAEAAYVRVISYEESKQLTTDQIISRFQFDHGIAHAHGGEAEPWNLTPLPLDVHREKTSKIDIPRIAKAKRLQRKEASHKLAMAGAPQIERPKRKMQSRGFGKQSRPVQRRAGR